MQPLIIGIVLIALAVAFVVLARRARRGKHLLIRWPGAVLAGLLAIVCALVGVVDLMGVYRLNAVHGNPVSDVKVAATSAELARGEHLAHLCTSCHSTTGDLPLDGGRTSLLSNPDGSGLGALYPPNLTPGSPLKGWSDGQIIRAVREGVDNNGHALMIMPSETFHQMSDADVQAIVAYLRSQPAVTHVTPPRNINLIGTLLIGTGVFPLAVQAPITQPVVAPPAGITPEYGKYLVAVSGCQTCHGADLAGGRAGAGPPPGPNLTQIVPKWTRAQFVTTIRTGTDPTGYALRPDMMPWKEFSAAYSDDELGAIYAYLHTVKPIEHPSP
ncbi:MAG TPA: cytochrome c [Chloroflexota bacterium]|nr:cytochrome c [Chloroflexota bacterium]